jgi:hypothetical protein
MHQAGTRSRVIEVSSRLVMRSSVVDMITLDEMLQQGLIALTGAGELAEAWKRILGHSSRIVLKFNSVGANIIGTNAALARTLVDQLRRSGYAARNIVLVEAPEHLPEELSTAAPPAGWGEQIRVGSNAECLARYLLEADAVINVPTLKTHQIAGLSGCMKNLSHAVIRHPGRYHANACAPYVGQVVGSPQVSSRLKLNLVNALRIVVERGPDAHDEDIASAGAILLGHDPVAVDSVGLGLLSVERRRRSLTGIQVPYLVAAGDAGVGRWHPADVEHFALVAEG